MPWYFRFGFGPFRFRQRLGRTQAQKRAAAKARQQRAAARALAERDASVAEAMGSEARTFMGLAAVSDGGRTLTVADVTRGTVRVTAPDDRFSLLHDGDVVSLTPNADRTAIEAFHLGYAKGGSAEQSPLNRRTPERARLLGMPPGAAGLAWQVPSRDRKDEGSSTEG
jgi:hypothetical protein